MNFKETLEARASIREFTNESIPEADLRELVRLAGLAPSLDNIQPWKFVAITNRKLLSSMAEIVIESISSLPATPSRLSKNIKSQFAWYSSFFEDSPALIAIAVEPIETILTKGISISEKEINVIRNYPDLQSVGACVENFLLAAVDMGYGACWLSGPLFAKAELERLLNIQKPWELCTFVTVGKPKFSVKPKLKRNLGTELTILA